MPRVDLAAGFPRPALEAAPGLGLVAKCGALGAEVAVRHAAAQHVVACREHGRDAGEDRLPVAAPRLDAEEPGLDFVGLAASPYGKGHAWLNQSDLKSSSSAAARVASSWLGKWLDQGDGLPSWSAGTSGAPVRTSTACPVRMRFGARRSPIWCTTLHSSAP